MSVVSPVMPQKTEPSDISYSPSLLKTTTCILWITPVRKTWSEEERMAFNSLVLAGLASRRFNSCTKNSAALRTLVSPTLCTELTTQIDTIKAIIEAHVARRS
uniref:Uncharacterized protein n=1 Tax=Tetraselmis sp. GSL018 TaxID=582737 RepID=A0A061SJ38_9CHLO